MHKKYFHLWQTGAFFLLCLGLSTKIAGSESPECFGKIELAPSFVHIDILERGRSIKRMDLAGIRGELSYRFWNGFFIKPTLLYAHGAGTKGGMMSGTLSLGNCIPLTDDIVLSPSIGVGYSHLWTRVDLPHVQLKDLKQNFKSLSPLISIDLYYTLCKGTRISGTVQYAWARTHTSVAHIFKSKSHSKGFNYAIMLERDLSDHWSINLAGAYSLSLSKEKHGIRGSGVKLGLAYWF